MALSAEYMAGGRRAPMKRVKLTGEEESKYQISQAYLLIHAPFFADLFYSKLPVVFTHDIPIAATDGFRLFINPRTFFKYNVREQVFIICHEIMHCIWNDCGMAFAWQRAGTIICPGGVLPYNDHLMGAAMDFVINALLIDAKVGAFSKDWLYDPNMSEKGHEANVVVYEKLWAMQPPPPPPPPPGKGPGPVGPVGPGGTPPQPGGTTPPPPGGKVPGDGQTRFDEHLQPGAGTGMDPDEAQAGRSEAEWRVAVAAAAHAAEAQGKLPAGLKRFVGDILEPKQSWQDLIRSAISRRLGSDGYDWTQLDERQLLRPELGYDLVCFPQSSSFDCGTIAIGVDTSGSIGMAEVERFFSEMAGIVADLNPRQLIVLWCDAAVDRVDYLEEPQDLNQLKSQIDEEGVPGGGGTAFAPVFVEIEEKGLEPELLVYFTDLYGSFPKKAPKYPVVWGCITDQVAPFGETVRVEL